MINYKFTINEFGTPQFNVESKYWQLSELASCEDEYLHEIVRNLKDVLDGKINVFEFGYEVYSLECDLNDTRVLNTFEDWKVEATIPTHLIYDLLLSWEKFLESNSKKSK